MKVQEVTSETKILRHSKMIVCPGTKVATKGADSCRVFLIGGQIAGRANQGCLEYIREPFYLKKKASMIAHRYHHAAVFDPKRSRIYVFGGLGSQDQVLDEDLPLNSCEYYDIKTD